MFWVLFLVLACAVAIGSCGRLCLAAVRAAESEHAEHAESAESADARILRDHELSLYETAFLSGGPVRVADVTLVSMARARRLLLAHTGWATVVDPDGTDDMERSVIGAIGPEGQRRITPLRAATAAGDAVRALAERLVAAGLAVPDAARSTLAGAVRQVRSAAIAVVGLGALATLAPGQGAEQQQTPVALWFALPLLLTLSCLAIARIEIHPYTRWASPVGQRLLAARPAGADGLFAVAVRGVRAVDDPGLRAAFGDGRARRAAMPE
ncbi:TIGR04222 domain-containing membrane protein [Streptomyces sp. VRA16 Mangrove soil]|uniref:TIGR04222 domain-containing membrane protein n=1 Tax=Streptomyces sp. VRA16 Mangrove soil TaxID=2817434 RepID=UPI001A9E4617|nr:TIGR04222 domain-containing membrane protein [Streptomyces sp. VRA16 Mangrove soil]MBO1335560.1 TIGR04222 domain-containing membrane protein [Streptomyces sp. VRA16 Mangrove soil]